MPIISMPVFPGALCEANSRKHSAEEVVLWDFSNVIHDIWRLVAAESSASILEAVLEGEVPAAGSKRSKEE